MSDQPGRVQSPGRGVAGVTHCGAWTTVATQYGRERMVCTREPGHEESHAAWRGNAHALWPQRSKP